MAMPSYELDLSTAAERDLKALPERVQQDIVIVHLPAIKENPFIKGKPLSGALNSVAGRKSAADTQKRAFAASGKTIVRQMRSLRILPLTEAVMAEERSIYEIPPGHQQWYCDGFSFLFQAFTCHSFTQGKSPVR